jgi:hypothetical protein
MFFLLSTSHKQSFSAFFLASLSQTHPVTPLKPVTLSTLFKMKFTGFVATLAVAGAASAAAIPRDQMVSSTIQGALSQLNTVLGTVQGVANGATSNVDLSSVESRTAGPSFCVD